MTKILENKPADLLNNVAPYTFSQFEETLTGKYNQKVKENNQKGYCAKWCAIHTLLAPLDIVGRTLFNGANTVYKILKLACLTVVLPFNFDAFKKSWKLTSTQVLDCSLATVLSPMQPVAKIARLGVGILSPKTFFVPIEDLSVERQLDILNRSVFTQDLVFKSKAINSEKEKRTISKMTDEDEIREYEVEFHKVQNPQGLADLGILVALYNYASNWALVKGEPKYFLRGHQRVRLSELGHDNIDVKCHLFKEFQQVVNKWKQEGIVPEDLNRFFEHNFKTDDQRIVLDEFFKKGARRIEHYGDFYTSFADEGIWGKRDTPEKKQFDATFEARFKHLEAVYEKSKTNATSD